MDTGVRDLEVAFFKANSAWFDDKCSKDLSNRPIYAVLNTHNLRMILHADSNVPSQNRLVWLEILEMLWSMMRLIFKTSSVTPDFFYVFNLVISFSTCSQSFNKICVWEVLGANVLKRSSPSMLPVFTKYIPAIYGDMLFICPHLWKI